MLEAANGVISNNRNRKDKQPWSGIGGGKPIELCLPENESDEDTARMKSSLVGNF